MVGVLERPGDVCPASLFRSHTSGGKPLQRARARYLMQVDDAPAIKNLQTVSAAYSHERCRPPPWYQAVVRFIVEGNLFAMSVFDATN
jgi:hypothetical protein